MTRRQTLHDIPTPALVLDLDVLERNIRAMAEKISRLGASLRPHVKTHKCIEIGRRQLAAGARGITASTLVEARDFADHGFDDITWAFPVVTGRLDEVVALAKRVTFRVVVDSQAALDALAAAARAAGVTIHTWLKVDCGYHRVGVDPCAPASLELVRRLGSTPGVAFDGILTHAGHGYSAKTHDELKRIAGEERTVMLEFAARCRDAGLEVPAISIGSTPTISVVENLDGVTEVRPGNYVFYDWMQVANGVCRAEDVAVTVLSTVISHQPGSDHAVVDAGALAMSKDLGPADPTRSRGLGPVLKGLAGQAALERVSLRSVSQEHGVVAGGSAADVEGRFAVGERIRIVPNHSCLTAAMFDEYVVARGEDVQDRWKIWRGR
ncbi:MAG: alanine racemase [Gemmatimonadetes bacterium]|nr:alanine racemase [Gemmatimonadota bacterium]